jgi:hypothetical protein
MSREIFVSEMIIPVMSALKEALVKICPKLDEEAAQLAIFSIVGQLIHIAHVKPIFEQIDNPELPKFDLDKLINHIVKFSAAGIQAYAKGEIR